MLYHWQYAYIEYKGFNEVYVRRENGLGFIDKIRDNLSLRGNIPPLLLTSLLEGSAWNMHEVVWQPFVLSLGARASLVWFCDRTTIWGTDYTF